jgi:hypothetical protein
MPSTYAELKDQVRNFINKPDIDQTIDTFIDLAEADIARKVRHWKMEKRATVQLDDQYSRVPTDWLESIRFYLSGGDTYELELASRAELLSRRMNSVNTSGRPKYYTMSDGAFEIYPTPDAAYTAELLYFSQNTALSDENTSNWLLSDYPDVYLYGTLAHTAPFLGEDQRLPIWAQLYQSALDGVNMASEKARYSGSGLRMNIRSY